MKSPYRIILSFVLAAQLTHSFVAVAEASSFLKVNVSARPAALAGAGATGDTIGAVEQNPSALSSLRGWSAEFSQMQYFEGVSPNSFYAGYSAARRAFAVGFKSYSTDVSAWDSLGGNTGVVSHSENLIMAAYSSRIGRNWAAGLSAKSFSSRILDNSTGGVNTSLAGALFDAGLTYYRGGDVYAVAVTNFGPEMKYDYAGAITQKMPLSVALGARHNVGGFAGVWQVSRSDDNKRMTVASGVDYDVTPSFALRMGMKYARNFDLTFGAGFRFGKFYLDYAIAPHMDFGAVHNVSFGAKF